LWIDVRGKAYGLELQPGYTLDDSAAVEFLLDDELEMEVQTSTRTVSLPSAHQTLPGHGRVPMIRFLPTGFIAETSPEFVVLRQGPEEAIWIAQAPNRLSYEIQTNTFYVRR
jgi:hypothetical protein